MFNTIKIAKIVGIIFLLLGIIGIPFDGMRLTSVTTPFFEIIFVIMYDTSLMFVGYGLINKKRWAVYGTYIVTILKFLQILITVSMGEKTITSMFILLVIYILLSIWFTSSLKRFVK